MASPAGAMATLLDLCRGMVTISKGATEIALEVVDLALAQGLILVVVVVMVLMVTVVVMVLTRSHRDKYKQEQKQKHKIGIVEGGPLVEQREGRARARARAIN